MHTSSTTTSSNGTAQLHTATTNGPANASQPQPPLTPTLPHRAQSPRSTSREYIRLLNELLKINMNRKVRLGIENTQHVLNAVGAAYSPDSFPVLHVAGTNGKGSVSTKLANILERHGLRVGLFTSPHISTFRERMLINGQLISEDEVCELLPPLLDATVKHDIAATFFELTTLLGFGYFNHQKVDVAVIEVGLGGRLDSTNIVHPVISVVTSIGLEHTEYLGTTIESITREKCGIIKPDTPAVVGPSVPIDIVNQIATAKLAEVTRISDSFSNYDEENSKIAEVAFRRLIETNADMRKLIGGSINEQALQLALLSRPPCRFQQFQYDIQQRIATEVPDTVANKTTSNTTQTHSIGVVPIVLDVGHNPAAFVRLFEMVQQYYPKHSVRVVVGFSREKDAVACLRTLIGSADHLHFVYAQQSPRATPVQSLMETIQQHQLNADNRCKIEVLHNGDVSKTVTEALLRSQLHHNPQRPELLVVAGTFFIMADARFALGLTQETDPFDLNENSAGRITGNQAAPSVAHPPKKQPIVLDSSKP